jgi:hypothetical protein
MDHDLMWSNDFEGEAFLEISKLSGITNDSNNDNRSFDELKQIEISLTHPKSLKKISKKIIFWFLFLAVRSRIIEVLEQRVSDKIAIEFVRRRRETENQ